MKKTDAAAFALLTAVTVTAQAQTQTADPLLEDLANQTMHTIPPTASAKIEDYCTHFNQVVAPVLSQTGISESLYAKMKTYKGGKVCIIWEDDGLFVDSPVAFYDASSAAMNDADANRAVATQILHYIIPEDRAKIARALPGLLHPH